MSNSFPPSPQNPQRNADAVAAAPFRSQGGKAQQPAAKAPGRERHGHPGWNDELWHLRFAELREYRDTYGNARVPANWRGNPSLGRWLCHQRGQYRRGQMESDRAKRLEELGVEWTIPEFRVERQDLVMDRMLARLATHRERHGDVPVSRKHDPKLAKWIFQQRHNRKTGRMRQHRLERLDAAGFPWVCIDRSADEPLLRLAGFHKRFGHTWVPARWEEDVSLGRWVAHQRELHRAGTMPAERRRRLDELGFAWEAN